MSRLLVLIPLLLLAACSDDPQVTALLDRADSLTYVQPDSAIRLLHVHEAEAATWSRSLRMRHALLTARAQNKAFIDFTTDSVLFEVADYYDRHGTPNQQLEAHYLLGCAYRDLGEAPMAVGEYQDALDMAEALEGDCNSDVYLGILGQLASLFHSQYLPHDELLINQQYQNYALQINDSMEYAYAKAQMMKPYYLMGENDSVLMVVDEAYRFYKEHGLQQFGSQFLPPAIYIYTIRRQYEEARRLINAYEGESGLFDSCGNIARGREHYYYTKGFYYQNIEKTDSAEFLYRKLLKQGNYDADAYKGLLAIYHKRQEPDSIAKYATLYCAANDSSIFVKDQELTAQMAASYNYNRYQHEAFENATQANKRLFYAVIFLAVAIVSIIVAFIYRLQYRKKQLALERLRKEHTSITEQYERKLQQLEQLGHTHQQTIATIQQELGRAQSEKSEAQHIIERLNGLYDTDKQLLTEEISTYINKVEELERTLLRSNYRTKMLPFMKLGIVKRVRLYAKESQRLLAEGDLKQLEDAANDYFPDLLYDLNAASGIGKLGTQVCLLVILELQPNEITHLLNISSAQVANLKKDINQALFNELTARTLYKNLSARYKFNTA